MVQSPPSNWHSRLLHSWSHIVSPIQDWGTSWRTCSKKQTSFQTIISKYSKYFLTETQSIMVLCFKIFLRIYNKYVYVDNVHKIQTLLEMVIINNQGNFIKLFLSFQSFFEKNMRYSLGFQFFYTIHSKFTKKKCFAGSWILPTTPSKNLKICFFCFLKQIYSWHKNHLV